MARISLDAIRQLAFAEIRNVDAAAGRVVTPAIDNSIARSLHSRRLSITALADARSGLPARKTAPLLGRTSTIGSPAKLAAKGRSTLTSRDHASGYQWSGCAPTLRRSTLDVGAAASVRSSISVPRLDIKRGARQNSAKTEIGNLEASRHPQVRATMNKRRGWNFAACRRSRARHWDTPPVDDILSRQVS